MSIPKTGGSHAPDGRWPGDVVSGWEWPVRWGWHVDFADGSEAYYPSWECIPNRILQMQEGGAYEDVVVTVVTWGDE